MSVENSTVSIPLKLHDRLQQGGRGVSTRLQELALGEAGQNRPLRAPPTDRLAAVRVALSPALKRAIPSARARMPRGVEWTTAQVIASLAMGALFQPQESTDEPSTRETCTKVLQSIPGLPARPEQLALSKHIDQALEHGRIAMLEAATGTGKGLLLAAAAVGTARRRLRSAIAAPSHQIADQIARHLATDLASQIPQGCGIARVYGRSSFVSGSRLQDAISDHERIAEPVREDAQAWLDEQDRQFLKGARSGLYMLDALLERIPALPADDIRLRSTDEDSAAECYESQFAAAREARILILTHAMLAALTKFDYLAASRALAGEKKSDNIIEHIDNLTENADPRLGPINVLLIDEAHFLESLFANAMSETVSLRSLERRTEKLCSLAGTGSRAGSCVKSAVKRIAAMANEDIAPTARDEALLALAGALKKVLSATTLEKASSSGAVKAKSLREIKVLRSEISRSSSSISSALTNAAYQMIDLTYSPSRHYPQLLVGPRSVRRYLEFMWRQVDAAVLVSATLYTQTLSSVPSCAMMAARLSVDPLRRITHVPTLPAWLTDCVTLHLAPGDAKAWAPPSSDAPESDFSAYFSALSHPFNAFCESARGGSLVLCTSHQGIAELAVRWDGDPSRLVVQSRDEPFSLVARRFAQLALNRKRPVLLATGQAWTGFNIYSAIPEDIALPKGSLDDLLTHLLITRAPFDNMVSSTELARREKRDFNDLWPAIAYECQMRLRQGVGRLVRRPDVHDRHIAVLDPRICAEGFRGMGMLRNIWLPYRNQRVIDRHHPFKVSAPAKPKAALPALQTGKKRWIVD